MVQETERWLEEQNRKLEDCSVRWSTVERQDQALIHEWHGALAGMQTEMRESQLAGLWVRGGTDLLTIVGLNRWELAHSSALAWLLDPFGSHQLGAEFLISFAAKVGAPIDANERVEVRVEESRTTKLGQVTRADVVVAGETWTLLIEVKVDAIEGPRQAARLYECWSVDPCPSFVFLTRTGEPPGTVDDDCRDAWVPVTWRWMAQELEAVVATREDPMRALSEYAGTLKGMFA